MLQTLQTFVNIFPMSHAQHDNRVPLHGVKHPVFSHAKSVKPRLFSFQWGNIRLWSGLKGILAQEPEMFENLLLNFPAKFRELLKAGLTNSKQPITSI
jgi:hypothetical protein